ncbi:MAG: hypothetical protein GC159_09790 [Phycisphaera sp.]|nr:hypothetical protein [Phycisphaera sp.]
MTELKDDSKSIWPLTAMCVIATVALGISAKAVVAPSIICLLLVSYLWLGGPRMPKPRMFLALLLMVPYALWLRDHPQLQQSSIGVPTGFLFVVGLYMMSLAAHHMLALENGGSMDYALSCAVMGMGMAGTAKLADSPRGVDGNPVYLPLLLAFLPLMLLHLRREQIRRQAHGWSRRSWLVYTAAFGALLVGTFAVDYFGVRRIPELNAYLIQRMAEAGRAAGMRGTIGGPAGSSTRLGDWIPQDGTRDNEIALVAFSEDEPAEYLRGSSYVYYHDSTWETRIDTTPKQPETEEFQGRRVFMLRDGRTNILDTTIYAESAYTNAYFLPMDVHKIATFARRVQVGETGTVRPDGRGAAGGYGYFRSTSRQPAPEGIVAEVQKQVPDELRDKLRAIGDRIMGRGRTNREKIDLLRNHFTQHYHYKLGIRLHTDKDPVIEFLEDHDAGHCEYFAASTALLLRAQGIPCRYVTGFVMRERGMGGMWIARRRNAHAWVEAYLPDEGWVIVESTPASAQPAVASRTRREQLSEWFDAQWMRISRVGEYGGVKALLIMFWEWLLSLPQKLPMWIWLILITIGMAWIFRDTIRRWITPPRQRDLTDEAREIQSMLIAAEKLLKRHALIRPPGQTVATFLHRVREASQLPDPVRDEALGLLTTYEARRFAPLHRDPAADESNPPAAMPAGA